MLFVDKRNTRERERDHIDVRESNTPSLLNSSTENGNFRKENISSKVVTKEDLIKNVNIPSHKPLNLTEHQINPHLFELCSKGPSFIPTPSSVNWYAQTSQLSRFHGVSHGFTAFLTVSRYLHFSGFTNFERILSQTYSFLKKQTQAAHFNVNKERISSMINKNKTSIRSSLSLSWVLLFIMLVKTHIGVPFQWKTPSELLKIAKRLTTKYN